VLAALVMIAAQTVVAGWAVWSAGNAARAGARAAVVGSDTEAAARRALPGVLRGGAVIKDADGVRVQVRIPGLVPGIELPSVAAASRLDEGSG
jgi:hypothetical protein